MLIAHPIFYLCSALWTGETQAGLTLVTEEQEIIKHLLLPKHFAGRLIEPISSSHKVGTVHMQDLTLRIWNPGLCDRS